MHLSHQISAAGSKPTPQNTEAVAKMKAPTTVKEIRRFLRMCGLYMKHALYLKKSSALLTNLTHTRTSPIWTDKCQKAFEHLKACLMAASILVKTQIDQPIILA